METNDRGRGLFAERPQDYVGLVYALVLIWGIGDILSTYVAYTATGDGSLEANPWISLLLSQDPFLVIALKGAVVLYTGIILLELQYFVRRTPGWRLWLSALVVSGILVVGNNLVVALAFL
jgi:hypothetical protein